MLLSLEFRFLIVNLVAGADADIMGSGLMLQGVRYDFDEMFLWYLLMFRILETIVLEHKIWLSTPYSCFSIQLNLPTWHTAGSIWFFGAYRIYAIQIWFSQFHIPSILLNIFHFHFKEFVFLFFYAKLNKLYLWEKRTVRAFKTTIFASNQIKLCLIVTAVCILCTPKSGYLS